MFIAGAYTALLKTGPGTGTLNYSLGQIERGITFRPVIHAEDITGDTYANTIQDGVYLGRNATVSFVLLEADRTAVQYLIEPFVKFDNRGDLNQDFGRIETPGYLMSNFFSYIQFTKVTGPNATPTEIHCEKCCLSRDYPVDTLYGNNLKKLPIQLTLYPFTVSSRSYLWRTVGLTTNN